MIKNYIKIIILIMISLSFTSCAKKETETVETSLNNLFFDVVYYTRFYRIKGNTNWKTLEGKQRIKFTNDASDSTLSSTTGNFIVSYEAYKESGLYNANYCSGGYTGSFVSTATELATTDTTTTDTVYDPSTPYTTNETTNTNTTEVDPVTGEELPQETYSFEFQLTVKTRSLSSGCTAVRPLDIVNLDIIRFTSNGDLIITDNNRGLEFYMQPELL